MISVFFIASVIANSAPRVSDVDPHAQVEASIVAMGGRNSLLSVHSAFLNLRMISYRIDDSERSEGPYWIDVLDGREWRDEDGSRVRAEMTNASAQWTVSTKRIDDGRLVAEGTLWQGRWQWSARRSIGDRVALSPERLLLTAASAPDLKSLPRETLWHVPQDVVGFTWRGMQVRLYMDRNLHLPSRLVVTRGNSFERLDAMLGDATYVTDLSFYKPVGGIRYPMQWTTMRDGRPFATTVVTRFEPNPPSREQVYALPADAAIDLTTANIPYSARTIPVPADGDPLRRIASDVWQIEGAWNVLVVRQADGLVVVECPQSGGYSEQVLTLLRARFPNTPIKALISTTDSLWHIAGVRPYVAEGIAIYALNLNIPALMTLIDNRRSYDPDRLSNHPRKPLIEAVTGRTVVGEGANRIELYPVAGRADERMMMAYLPALGLLYGSSNDISAATGQPAFNDFEIVARVTSLRLPVKDYTAIHTELMPWNDFEKIVAEKSIISNN
jgi:hypothetical protein